MNNTLLTPERFTFYTLLRLLLLIGVLASIIVSEQFRLFPYDILRDLYAVTFFTLLVTTSLTVLHQKLLRLKYFLYTQITYDLIFASLLLTISEKQSSIYVLFYILNLGFASMFLSHRLVLIISLVSAVLFSFIDFVLNGSFSISLAISTTIGFSTIGVLFSFVAHEIYKSKRTLGRLEELHSEIVESLDAGLCLIKKSGEILYHTPNYLKFLNVTSEAEILTKTKQLLSHESHADNLDNAVETEQLLDVDQRRILINKIPFDENSTMIVVRDLTSVLELEEKLRHSNHLATIGNLTAGLAHELRNPVGSIAGASQLLNDETDSESRKKLLHIIEKECFRIDRLINELLNYAKPSRDKSDRIPLEAYVKGLIQTSKLRYPLLNKASIEIHIESNIYITMHQDDANEVFENLIANAVHAMTDSATHTSFTPELTITAEINDNCLIIDFADSGCGIPKEFMERVFQPFFTTKSFGTGLGLAQVAKILDNYGAEISVQKSDKKGTTFRMRLNNFSRQNRGS